MSPIDAVFLFVAIYCTVMAPCAIAFYDQERRIKKARK